MEPPERLEEALEWLGGVGLIKGTTGVVGGTLFFRCLG